MKRVKFVIAPFEELSWADPVGVGSSESQVSEKHDLVVKTV